MLGAAVRGCQRVSGKNIPQGALRGIEESTLGSLYELTPRLLRGPDDVSQRRTRPFGGSLAVVVFGGYQRSLAGGSWSTEAVNASRRHRTSIRWEGDDPSVPLFGTISDAERAKLADSRSGSITMSAAEWAGDRGGDYRLDTATGDSIFVYAGPENGDWRVRFEWVGPGLGRYRHLAEAAYEYVGPNRGAYEPRRTLSAPEGPNPDASTVVSSPIPMRPPSRRTSCCS